MSPVTDDPSPDRPPPPPRQPSPADPDRDAHQDREQRHAARRERLEAIEQAAIEAELETGRREPTVHAAKRSLAVRAASMVLGGILVLAGLVMLVIPGPGLLAIAIGLGILAPDVPFAARLLERVKQRLPQDADGKLPSHVIAGMVATAVVATAGSLWFAFR